MNSTEGYDPFLVSLDARDPTGDLMANFQSGSNRILVPIPSYGIATIPLTVYSSEIPLSTPHTMVLQQFRLSRPDELYGYPGFDGNWCKYRYTFNCGHAGCGPLSIEDVVSNFSTRAWSQRSYSADNWGYSRVRPSRGCMAKSKQKITNNQKNQLPFN